jgi:hypothetical protein
MSGSMTPDVTHWRPLEVGAIQSHLGAFRAWCLCGGQSLDWMIGRATRPHGDTDIGVFRSDLRTCLEAIGAARVFLCEPPGDLVPWDGADVPVRVHDIWIVDPSGQYWVLQIMVFDDAGDSVLYRRDPRIRWSKAAHAVTVQDLPVLNPVVTLLFKTNRPRLEDRDCLDLQVLIEEVARYGSQGIGRHS